MLKELFKYYETTSHSNTTLAIHLRNTHDILLKWGAKEHVRKAALFHTIYNTQSFKLKDSIPLHFRGTVKSEIGKKAERLIFLYAKKEKSWFNNIIQKIYKKEVNRSCILIMPLIDNLGFEKITRLDISEICSLILANTIEQVPRQGLAFYDESHWNYLYTIGKKSLPSLNSSVPLFNFENIGFEKSILDLPSFLSWESCSCLKDVVSNFDKNCSNEFNKCLTIIDHEYIQEIPCRHLYSSLNNLSKINSALSPKLLSKYLNREQFLEKGNLKKIYDAFLLQYMIETKNLTTHNNETNLSSDDSYFVNYESGTIEKTPTYLSTLKIDYKSSDYDDVWNQGNHTPNLSHYSEEDIRTALDRVSKVFDFIKVNNSLAFELIIQVVKVVSLRTDKNNLESFGSSSWPHSPGLIGIINICNKGISDEKIVSSIVHETIHSYLYYIEIFFPFSNDVNRYYSIKAKSPWTNRVLPIASFIHACFVWYGIYHFWVKLIKRDGYKINYVTEANKCGKGFLSNEYLVEIEKIKLNLRDDIYQSLIKLRDTTKLIEETNAQQEYCQ